MSLKTWRKRQMKKENWKFTFQAELVQKKNDSMIEDASIWCSFSVNRKRQLQRFSRQECVCVGSIGLALVTPAHGLLTFGPGPWVQVHIKIKVSPTKSFFDQRKSSTYLFVGKKKSLFVCQCSTEAVLLHIFFFDKKRKIKFLTVISEYGLSRLKKNTCDHGSGFTIC